MASTKGAKDWHPFSIMSNRKVKLEEKEGFALCFDFVADVCNNTCVDFISGHKSKRTCQCLSILRDSAARQAAVAKYMASFGAKRVQERHSIVMEWQRYTSGAANSDRCFFLPFLTDDDDDEYPQGDNDDNPLDALKDWMVCRDAISLLLDYHKVKWKTCRDAVVNNKLPEHGNKGKVLGRAKRFAEEVKEDLDLFFQEMKQFSTPTATRVVREECGTGLRDGEENVFELPTSWSKRGLYARFCFERGYTIGCNARGNITKTERSDQQWNIADKKTICSWHAFLKFWERNYPMIRLASPSADICTDCHIFFNRAKYVARRPANELSDDSSSNSLNNDARTNESNLYPSPVVKTPTTTLGNDDGNNEINQLGVVVVPTNDEPTNEEPQDLQAETQLDMLERESILLKATLHVQQASIQRQLANKKIQEAIDSSHLPHSERSYCFIADYSQNMELPFFGASQPGDTYYFTPLKINVFGIVDCCIFGGKLSAHVYHEGIGKKGGNNVASLLVNELKRLNIMLDNATGKELTIIMDNCAGQNKNRMVLRLATYLVEAEYFAKVSFIFYIVGHTKNACDRWFNTLKRTYRRSNIYSINQLTTAMQHPMINITVVQTTDFKDWDKFFNSIYKKLAAGTVHKTHIFSANNEENKTLLRIRNDGLPETQETTQDLMIKGGANTPERFALLRSPNLDTIRPPGIPPIKQMELFTKYRQLIPEQFRAETCPDPGEQIKQKIKSERNAKAREKKKSKIDFGLEEAKNDKQEAAANQKMEEGTI